MVENYIDISPAAARSNQDAVKILKSEILDITVKMTWLLQEYGIK